MSVASPATCRIGWIGVGVMGRWMCQHLLDAGYSATVYSRTASKCKPLVDSGAVLAGSPREVAELSDVVFSIVGYPKDVREVILNESTGALGGLREGGIIVDMTTSKPSLAVEISEEARKKGCFGVDAPVSGGDVGAREARLSVMVGADDDAFARVKPLFDIMGKNVKHMGKPGAGQHTKMVNQVRARRTHTARALPLTPPPRRRSSPPT